MFIGEDNEYKEGYQIGINLDFRSYLQDLNYFSFEDVDKEKDEAFEHLGFEATLSDRTWVDTVVKPM